MLSQSRGPCPDYRAPPTPARGAVSGAAQSPTILKVQKGHCKRQGKSPCLPLRGDPGVHGLCAQAKLPSAPRRGLDLPLPLLRPAPHFPGARRTHREAGPRTWAEFASDTSLLFGSLCY